MADPLAGSSSGIGAGGDVVGVVDRAVVPEALVVTVVATSASVAGSAEALHPSSTAAIHSPNAILTAHSAAHL